MFCGAIFGLGRFSPAPRYALALACAWLAGPGSSKGLAQSADPAYEQTIRVSADASAEVLLAAQSLKDWLERMTGMEFSVTDEAGEQGIFLALATSDAADGIDPLHAEESRDAFMIRGDAVSLRIVGKTVMALENGIHWYLEQLGCRWLQPGDKWTVIPKRAHIRIEAGKVLAPAFALRTFFGTGHFGRPAIDPQQQMADAWKLYQRQNLLSGLHPDAIRLGGHAGEAFLVRHRDTLIANPEYMAEVDGKREDPTDATRNAKLCSTNPGLQELWVEDRLAELAQAIERNAATLTVSVEPSDGLRHCECAECKKLGTVSDQIFFLANLVARAVARDFPGKCVNLYAYGEHAEPPADDVEPNVIVSMIPYAFQTTGMSPEEFVRAWGKKSRNLAMYDYWNIPDWSRNLPDLSPETLAERIRFWHENGVRYFNAESTFCGGSMGPNWFLAARLLWDPGQDEKAILDDYFTSAFGAAQGPMRAMRDRWGDAFILSDHELALSFRDLREALSLARDPAITARLVDMGRYLHYLRLWNEYLFAKPKTPERVDAAKAVLNYLWRVYDSNMVQVFRMAQLINRDELPELEELHNELLAREEIPQLTDAEVLSLLDEGIARYEPLKFEPRTWESKLIPLQSDHSAGTGEIVETPRFGFGSDFQFHARGDAGGVRLAIWVGTTRGEGKFDTVTVQDPSGQEVFRERITNIPDWQELEIPTPVPGNYTLSVFDQKNTFRLRLPADLPFVCTGPLTSTDLSPRTWFYVPPDTKAIALHSPGVIPLKIYNPDGDLVDVPDNEDGKNLFLIEVAPGEAGRAWSFAQFKSYKGIRLLNCPNVFSWSPEALMVPANASP